MKNVIVEIVRHAHGLISASAFSDLNTLLATTGAIYIDELDARAAMAKVLSEMGIRKSVATSVELGPLPPFTKPNEVRLIRDEYDSPTCFPAFIESAKTSISK